MLKSSLGLERQEVEWGGGKTLAVLVADPV